MKHGYFGRKLGRNVDERRRLFMVLTRSLIQLGRIKTTFAKAKAIQPAMDKLITKAKSASNASVREMRKNLASEPSVKALLEMAKTRFSTRTSGYTRIIKLGKRYGDAAEEVILEFVDAAPVTATTTKKTKATKVTAETPAVQEAEVVTEEASVKKPKARATSKK
jgi:large subunit ribosomal protein L17